MKREISFRGRRRIKYRKGLPVREKKEFSRRGGNFFLLGED